MSSDPSANEIWRYVLTNGEPAARRSFHLMGLLPSNPRCRVCNAPFEGLGGWAMRLIGKRRSKNNPNFCDVCGFLSTVPGGAEVELTLLFADVRGSTALAEQMTPVQFSHLMKRFYAGASDVLVKTDALIDKFVGDEVIALYVPGYAGAEHARRAVEAAKRLLKVTGHGSAKGPWLPLGIGIHTGIAYVGMIQGVDGVGADVTALGDSVNIAARLVAQAGPGEIILSDATYTAARLDLPGLERRQLQLKGKSESVDVRVSRIDVATPRLSV